MIPEAIRKHSKIEELVRTGSAREEIIDTAKEIDADVIVMGAVGQGAAESARLGSTAYGVVTQVYCPVLTVR